jgi:hypothetical protein
MHSVELIMLRCRVHQVMDPIWRSGLMHRMKVYQCLADAFGIKLVDCHVGFMDEAECREALGHLELIKIEVLEKLSR